MSKRFEISANSFHEIQPGSFLVAAPSLPGSLFYRAVVFVLQNDSEGIFGAVINRPASQDIVANWSKTTGLNFERLSMIQGGPLSGPVMAIHQYQPLSEMQVCEGVCVSVDAKALQHLARSESQYRIVLGIAGWEPQQLSAEIASGFWYPLVVDPTHVFDDHAVMWESFVREFGRQTLQTMVSSRYFPVDPSLN